MRPAVRCGHHRRDLEGINLVPGEAEHVARHEAVGHDLLLQHGLFDGTDGLIVPVTYDFDQSGFVDAPYARPDERFRIRSVRQRLYRGRCVNNEYLLDSLEKFRKAKDDLYRLIREQEGLEDRGRKALVRYMDDFYDIINDPRKVARRMSEECI